jgi:hypothetical protein
LRGFIAWTHRGLEKLGELALGLALSNMLLKTTTEK